ncbi:serine carboxypeptidase-like 18 isoform X2 [Salvia miltiorrhiza]|uniref:serine carboxypeptidase-like 18 isoform X2 n=1 Tax=Salvia miltiorrhiza TaxID=226208 RepID=UPI0025AC6678|nr:serine carboxypeptidase-like 18 isoform X2 [Salvia miltiorrhiza]
MSQPHLRQLLLSFNLMLLLTAAFFTTTHSVIQNLPGFNGTFPFKLQTGYIGVGESEQVQLFYYFIESERSPANDPLLLWLTGGPGCSGFSGLVYEIGPLVFDYDNSDGIIPTLVLNPYSWTKVANIIFIDQPAGTGFSYATTAEAYKSSNTLSAIHTYQFLQKWLLNHPKFLNNPLYIAGDSYSGITVPLVVNQVYGGIEAGRNPVLNLKGYILGNPLTQTYANYNGRVAYAHRMGLLSDELYQSAKENCYGYYLSVDPSNGACKDDLERVTQCLEKIRKPHILEPWCDNMWTALLLPSDEGHCAPQSEPCYRDKYALYSEKWANVKLVQEALQVAEGTITEWARCNATLTYDLDYNQTEAFTYDVKSTVDDHKSFTYKDCRALVYSGDHDMVVPHTVTEEWIKSLKLQVKNGWRPWFVDGQVAGYTTEYFHGRYELTYATVKGIRLQSINPRNVFT